MTHNRSKLFIYFQQVKRPSLHEVSVHFQSLNVKVLATTFMKMATFRALWSMAWWWQPSERCGRRHEGGNLQGAVVSGMKVTTFRARWSVAWRWQPSGRCGRWFEGDNLQGAVVGGLKVATFRALWSVACWRALWSAAKATIADLALYLFACWGSHKQR